MTLSPPPILSDISGKDYIHSVKFMKYQFNVGEVEVEVCVKAGEVIFEEQPVTAGPKQVRKTLFTSVRTLAKS